MQMDSTELALHAAGVATGDLELPQPRAHAAAGFQVDEEDRAEHAIRAPPAEERVTQNGSEDEDPVVTESEGDVGNCDGEGDDGDETAPQGSADRAREDEDEEAIVDDVDGEMQGDQGDQPADDDTSDSEVAGDGGMEAENVEQADGAETGANPPYSAPVAMAPEREAAVGSGSGAAAAKGHRQGTLQGVYKRTQAPPVGGGAGPSVPRKRPGTTAASGGSSRSVLAPEPPKKKRTGVEAGGQAKKSLPKQKNVGKKKQSIPTGGKRKATENTPPAAAKKGSTTKSAKQPRTDTGKAEVTRSHGPLTGKTRMF